MFATDFSPCSEFALPYVRAIARHYGSTVHLVHVVGPMPIIGPLGVPYPDVDSENQAAQQKLDELALSDAFTGIPYRETVQRGPIGDVISRLVDDLHIDLIVLGTHGRRGLKHFVLGSVAEQVFRRASCPVFTVGPEAHRDKSTEARFATILYATDFSPASLHALNHALSLARTNKGRMILLHAVQEGTDAVFPYLEEAVADARRRLSDLIPNDPDISYQVVVQRGPAADIILKVAHDLKADLIVMGAHRGAILSAHAPWAIAHMVVCRASCPVLTVRR